MDSAHCVSTPIFICDAFAEERFKGNQAAVLMVPTSVYCMEWSAMNSLEASFGRGEPEEEVPQTEEERDRAAQEYAEDRDAKMGRAFQTVAGEIGLSRSAFVYRLPASRVNAIQQKIKSKVNEFETEYEEKCREEEDKTRLNSMLVEEDPQLLAAGASLKIGEGSLKHSDIPGVIPSTSFSLGSFGASFLATRSGTSILGLGTGKGPRRLHTQWFGLRWFTPKQEVKLSAHATIAAAHAIFESSRLCHFQSTRHLIDNVPVEFFIPANTDVLCFVTAAGIISVRRKERDESAYALIRDCATAVESYEVHLPANEAHSVADLVPERLKADIALALSIDASQVADVALSAKEGVYVVALTTASAVGECRPNEHLMRAAFRSDEFIAARRKDAKLQTPHALIVTAERPVDDKARAQEVVTRYFAPWLGQLEEPASGTAHAIITPYWLRRKQDGAYKVGDRLECVHSSARGGRMTAIIIGKKAERIALIGSAVTFLRGNNTFAVEE